MSPLDAASFTRRVQGALGALEGVEVSWIRPLALRVEVEGRPGTLDLASAWRRLQLDPSQLEDIVQHAVRTLPEATGGPTLDADQLRPMLRTLDDLARLARGRRGGAGRTRPLVGELVLSLVQDAPNSVRALSDADCDRLALGDAALWDVARANLGRLPISVEGAGRVRQVVAGGTYDATCLVHPRLLEHLPVGTLAAAPCRSVLLLGAEDRRQVRAELDALAREVHASRPHPLSPAIWRWDGGRWVAPSGRP